MGAKASTPISRYNTNCGPTCETDKFINPKMEAAASRAIMAAWMNRPRRLAGGKCPVFGSFILARDFQVVYLLKRI
jgi:hypothetical protein